MPASRVVDTDFAAQRFDVPATTGRSFTFQYDRSGLPSESRLDTWTWSATITFSTGEVVNLLELGACVTEVRTGCFTSVHSASA